MPDYPWHSYRVGKTSARRAPPRPTKLRKKINICSNTFDYCCRQSLPVRFAATLDTLTFDLSTSKWVTGHPCHGLTSCQFSASCAFHSRLRVTHGTYRQTGRQTDGRTDSRERNNVGAKVFRLYVPVRFYCATQICTARICYGDVAGWVAVRHMPVLYQNS